MIVLDQILHIHHYLEAGSTGRRVGGNHIHVAKRLRNTASVDLRQGERQELVDIVQAVLWVGALVDASKVCVACGQNERRLANRVLPQVGQQLRIKHLLSQLVWHIEHPSLGAGISIREPVSLLWVDDVVKQVAGCRGGRAVVR